ncbi:hypothetical protein niasHT_026344 [Heterodera trifolii]|uniref:Uncharacterized protein n=1 Tax=Heterodera trifolii TaxID=157864 RepID=A0ABD2K116_9BILA
MAVGGVSSGTIRNFTSFATFVRFPFGQRRRRIPNSLFPICHFHPLPSCLLLPPALSPFFQKTMGNFRTGQFDPNRAYDPNSLAQLSKWRKEFLDGRYGSKQPSPFFHASFTIAQLSPIPVIVGRQMFPGDDGYESEDDEILLPPPPIPPQIDPPPPNVPGCPCSANACWAAASAAERPCHKFDYHPPNVPAVRVQPMHAWAATAAAKKLPPPPIPPQLGPLRQTCR